MSILHIIQAPTSSAALCGDTNWGSGVCLGSANDGHKEATCKRCRDEAGLGLDVETQAPKKLVKYRYTITVLCGCELTEKQREYLESDIEGSIGWPANVFPDPEEVPVDEEGDEV